MGLTYGQCLYQSGVTDLDSGSKSASDSNGCKSVRPYAAVHSDLMVIGECLPINLNP